jgi:D-alanyl-D-alanine carboxypeptidase
MSRRHISSSSHRVSSGLASWRPVSWRLVVGLWATLAVVGTGFEPAQARAARGEGAQKQTARSEPAHRRPFHGSGYRPPYAAIVIDANTGQPLHEVDADEPRHPASLAKVMTLYLLFEQLSAGKLKLDTPLPVSARAAMTAPVRLGLKTNQTIATEDALKALVTKSANDAATVIAEAIGGSEDEFAKLMTRKARALGMTNTTYANASGLPAADQITTARDQATLARAIQDRFPDYYRYFSTPSFMFRGREIRTHVSLLGQLKGVDGIKTGYTEASGYNLTSSLRRDDKHIVAVVLGGTSNAARDTRMRQLLEEHLPKGTTGRTAPAIAESPDLEQVEPAPLPDHFRPPNGVKPVTAAASAVTEAAEALIPPLPASKPASLTSKTTTKSAAKHNQSRRATANGAAPSSKQAASTAAQRH